MPINRISELFWAKTIGIPVLNICIVLVEKFSKSLDVNIIDVYRMQVGASGKISSGGGLRQRIVEKNMQRGLRTVKTGKYAHPFASFSCS